MNVSIDAGTRETFHKIKGVDGFERVCENLQEYHKAGCVTLKYIFLPGINDKKEDIDGFVDLCIELKCKIVVIEQNIYDDVNDYTIEQIERLLYLIRKSKYDGDITVSLQFTTRTAEFKRLAFRK